MGTHRKVNFCTIIDDRTYEVCRYDTCHGFLHVHRFWLPEGRQTQDLEDPDKPASSYQSWFKHAMEDLEANGERYIQNIKRSLKQ